MALTALGNGLDLEVVQLVVVANDLLDGQEGRIDGAVPAHTPVRRLPSFSRVMVAMRRWCRRR